MKEKVKKGYRQCPATDEVIKSQECGTSRVSTRECPNECEYNPFGEGGYVEWRKINERLEKKVVGYIESAVGNRALKERIEEYRDDEENGEIMGLNFAISYYMLRYRGEDGKSLWERWESEGWRDLSNDERLMMGYMKNRTVVIMEVQSVNPGHSFEAIDLLDERPKAYKIVDIKASRRLARYDIFITIVTHEPVLSRLSGTMILLRRDWWKDYKEALLDRAEGRNAESPLAAIREWITCHPREVSKLVTEVGDNHVKKMISGLDGNYYTLKYRIQKGQEKAVKRLLKEEEEFERGEVAEEKREDGYKIEYAWIHAGKCPEFNARNEKGTIALTNQLINNNYPDGVECLGSIRLKGEEMELEMMGKGKMRFLKERAKELWGDKVELESESFIDLSEKLMEEEEEGDENYDGEEVFNEVRKNYNEYLDVARAEGISEEEATKAFIGYVMENLVEGEVYDEDEDEDGEEGLIENEMTAMAMEQHYERLLEEKIPVLGNRTPIEASQCEAIRPEFIEWLKGHVNQVERMEKEQGIYVDLSSFLEALGCNDELKVMV